MNTATNNSKGPGKLRMLRLPPGHHELAMYAESVTLARAALVRLKLAKDEFCVRMSAKEARTYGGRAREWLALYQERMAA